MHPWARKEGCLPFLPSSSCLQSSPRYECMIINAQWMHAGPSALCFQTRKKNHIINSATGFTLPVVPRHICGTLTVGRFTGPATVLLESIGWGPCRRLVVVYLNPPVSLSNISVLNCREKKSWIRSYPHCGIFCPLCQFLFLSSRLFAFLSASDCLAVAQHRAPTGVPRILGVSRKCH